MIDSIFLFGYNKYDYFYGVRYGNKTRILYQYRIWQGEEVVR